MAMKGKMFVSALSTFRNISVLALATLLAVAYQDGFFNEMMIPYLDSVGYAGYGAALLVYIGFVLQTMTSRKFQDKFMYKMKRRQIQNLNYTCLRLANDAKRNLPQPYLQRLRKVMQDKNDIVDSFFKGERNYLKEKIVEQTLNLVASYVKLTNNFCMRNRELTTINVGEIANRISMNTRKLNFTKDHYAAEDLKKVIEMDEKIINRLKEEKKDLERISTKLEYMESTVNMFKHQIMSNIESEEMLDKLETAVNEATALDSVLQERRRNRINM